MGKTRRQRIVELLSLGEWTLEELKEEMGVPIPVLVDDLRHVDKSLRHAAGELHVEPARCIECGFVFRERPKRRAKTPSRCPDCKSERIAPPRFRVA